MPVSTFGGSDPGHGEVFVLTKDTVGFDCGGFLAQLPSGAVLQVVGKGVIGSMAEVLSKGVSYFVYWRDLEDTAEDMRTLYS